MKKSITLFFLIFSCITLLSGQETQLQTYYTNTVIGHQYGYGFRYMNSKAYGMGIFYQSTINWDQSEGRSSYPFWGLELILPLKKCGGLQFSLTPKIGYVNNQFLVFVPEVETTLRIKKWISVGVITGIRARKASNGIKLSIHI